MEKLENWSFHVVVVQRTEKKFARTYNARAQLLLCSSNLLSGDVLVAFAVVFCIRSLSDGPDKKKNKQTKNKEKNN